MSSAGDGDIMMDSEPELQFLEVETRSALMGSLLRGIATFIVHT
jgi:hypothetical protein